MAAPSRGRTRRTKNEINMVPFIDVMLVLLIIFMVTAPLITPSQIEVPSVGQAAKGQPPKFVHVIIEKDESIEVREGPSGGEGRSIKMNQLAQQVQLVQGRLGNADGPAPVMISADKGIQYDTVVKAMDTLRNAGVERIGLSVKPSR